MDKIDEASDVVCLLTQRSVDRPWILYEAGVAKGKLGKQVIGVAMGIQHSVAFTGPFAQFQNNDGSIQVVRFCPNRVGTAHRCRWSGTLVFGKTRR